MDINPGYGEVEYHYPNFESESEEVKIFGHYHSLPGYAEGYYCAFNFFGIFMYGEASHYIVHLN